MFNGYKQKGERPNLGDWAINSKSIVLSLKVFRIYNLTQLANYRESSLQMKWDGIQSMNYISYEFSGLLIFLHEESMRREGVNS